MQKLDREALELAVELCRADPIHATQIAEKLAEEPWEDVAEFCVYSCQVDALNLKPWQEPPCRVDVSDENPAAELLKRMLAAGVSQFHPDPLATIAAAGTRDPGSATSKAKKKAPA